MSIDPPARVVALLLAGALLLPLGTGTAVAAESVQAASGTIVVDEGEAVEVSETGRVGGDLQVGGHVEIDGRVDGSVTAGVDRPRSTKHPATRRRSHRTLGTPDRPEESSRMAGEEPARSQLGRSSYNSR